MHLDREEFFSRMILMDWIGSEGLEKLKNTTIAIVGVGGLGSHLALYLSLSGVGRIKLVDPDIVEYNNIHRQILYKLGDTNLFKVEVARKTIKRHTNYTRIDIYPMMLTPWNVERIFKNVDIILDGTDNFSSRFLINRYSVKHKIPYLYTAVESFYASLSFINYPETPCLECFYAEVKAGKEVNPITVTTVSLAASIEANEAIKYLIRGESSIKGKLLMVDLRELSSESLDLSFNPNCKAHKGDYWSLEYDFDLFWDRGTLVFNPRDKIRLDLEPLSREVADRFILLRRGEIGIVFLYNNYKVGVSYSGNVIIKNLESKENGVKIVDKLVNEVFAKYVID